MSKSDQTVQKITLSAVLMAMNIILSMSFLSIPVPGAHIYLCDAVIVTAAVLLDPFYAAIVGGVGSFLGDMLFYPAPMFVSLVTHGLQGFVVSLMIRKLWKDKPALSTIVAALVGLVITVAGYTFGRAFIYSTKEAAILGLPFQALQTGVGSALAWIICWPLGLVKLFNRTRH